MPGKTKPVVSPTKNMDKTMENIVHVYNYTNPESKHEYKFC